MTAAAWEHAAATVRCAELHRMGRWLDRDADPVGAVRAGLEALAAAHPALGPLADPRVNPAMGQAPGQAAAIVRKWRDHTVGERFWDTRWLGDLYQIGSEEARKERALCQTPAFVADLLLKCSLDNAVEEWPTDEIRVIDPSCGTGHLLLDTFGRSWGWPEEWRPRSVRRSWVDHVAHKLDRICGVDLDPYAAALARLRLLLFASIYGRGDARLTLADWRDLPVHVSVANSLLSEDEPLLERGRYHVVVGNPPYIQCPDKKARDAIRARYRAVACGNYSLAAPFEVLMHELAVPGGWVARITTNAFQRREWGRGMVQYLAGLDLRWVIDSSGAYIPGHGTPTCILVSRNRPPDGETVQVVQGKRGEPSTPEDPAKGVVWTTIREQVCLREDMARFARGAARWERERRALAETIAIGEAAGLLSRKPSGELQLNLFGGGEP